jgi:hypothetical protein
MSVYKQMHMVTPTLFAKLMGSSGDGKCLNINQMNTFQNEDGGKIFITQKPTSSTEHKHTMSTDVKTDDSSPPLPPSGPSVSFGNDADQSLLSVRSAGNDANQTLPSFETKGRVGDSFEAVLNADDSAMVVPEQEAEPPSFVTNAKKSKMSDEAFEQIFSADTDKTIAKDVLPPSEASANIVPAPAAPVSADPIGEEISSGDNSSLYPQLYKKPTTSTSPIDVPADHNSSLQQERPEEVDADYGTIKANDDEELDLDDFLPEVTSSRSTSPAAFDLPSTERPGRRGRVPKPKKEEEVKKVKRGRSLKKDAEKVREQVLEKPRRKKPVKRDSSAEMSPSPVRRKKPAKRDLSALSRSPSPSPTREAKPRSKTAQKRDLTDARERIKKRLVERKGLPPAGPVITPASKLGKIPIRRNRAVKEPPRKFGMLNSSAPKPTAIAQALPSDDEDMVHDTRRSAPTKRKAASELPGRKKKDRASRGEKRPTEVAKLSSVVQPRKFMKGEGKASPQTYLWF